MLDLEKYTFIDGKTSLSESELNNRFWALVRRLHALELLSVDWAAAVAEVQNHGLARINEAVLPLLDSLKSDLDALVAQGSADLAGYAAEVDGLIARGDAAIAANEAAAAVFMAQVNATLAGLQAVVATLCPLDSTGLVPEALLPIPALPDVAPALALPFDLMGGLPGVVELFRASTGWRLNAAGAIVSVAANVPRFDFDAAGAPLGLLVESAATRLNTIAAAPVAPESINVSAQAYTLSFYGSGSMALSGAHTATVVGAGPLPRRVSYTFTPTAGTLVLTPSGDVRHLQVEAGSCPTSPILGDGGQVTRAAESVTVALSGIDFNAAEGAVYIEARTAPGTSTYQILAAIDNAASGWVQVFRGASRTINAQVAVSGVPQAALTTPVAIPDSTRVKIAFSWGANAFRVSFNGGAIIEDTAGDVPTGLTTLRIGASNGALNQWRGHIRHLAYFPRALTAAQLQALTQ